MKRKKRGKSKTLPIVRYNRFLKRSLERYGLRQTQGRKFYRGLKRRLERTPTVPDLTERKKIANEEARRAFRPEPRAVEPDEEDIEDGGLEYDPEDEEIIDGGESDAYG
jgi:hypothetical protein